MIKLRVFALFGGAKIVIIYISGYHLRGKVLLKWDSFFFLKVSIDYPWFLKWEVVLTLNFIKGRQPCVKMWLRNILKFERSLIICLSLFSLWRHWCHICFYFLMIIYYLKRESIMTWNSYHKNKRNGKIQKMAILKYYQKNKYIANEINIYLRYHSHFKMI